MATARAIKSRIRSTKNIRQITRAMEAVSAVKMRKSQMFALRARPYALAALELMRHIRAAVGQEEQAHTPLLEQRPVAKKCLVVVTSDKGLAGSFNTNVLRKVSELIKTATVPIEIIAVGKRGKEFFSRRNVPVVEAFFEAGDFVKTEETQPIAQAMLKRFLAGDCDEVDIIYTSFLSALKQQVVVRRLLPVSIEGLEKIVKEIVPEHGTYTGVPEAFAREAKEKEEILFEPSPAHVLKQLIPALLEIEIYHCVLEANASEHSSRMVTMRNASDNAGELIGSLTLSFNKARQAQITKELTEISAGADAISGAGS